MATAKQHYSNTRTYSQKKKRYQFYDKHKILKHTFTLTSQMDYIYRVWGSNGKQDMEILLQRYQQRDDGTWKGTYFEIIIDEIFDLLLFRDDLYSYYTDFRNGKVGIKTVERVRAFCIDLDHMSPKDLKKLVSNKLTKMEHPPSYIVNTGNGIHLIYLFKEPIDVSSGGRIFGMSNLLKRLAEQFKPTRGYKYKLDGQSNNLVQAYRVPGSLTKNGEISRVYKSGPEYELPVLEEWLDCKTFSNNENPPVTQSKPKLEYLPNGKKSFYTYCLEKVRIPDKTNRYMAMFAIAIIGWKCRIPKERVLQDLKELLNYYNNHASGNPGG